MKIYHHIHPDFKLRQDEILALPKRIETEGELLYKVRNCIKKINMGNGWWNVKAFKVPDPINRFAYRHIRKSKAERSFRHSIMLLERGVSTPQPIAYIVERNFLKIEHSYYISEQVEYDYTLLDLFKQQPDDIKHILDKCTRFINYFHHKGVYFHDLSVGNILIRREPMGEFSFYLVDVNRAKFFDRPLTCAESIKAFCRLDAPPEYKEWILHQYAHIAGYDFNEVIKTYNMFRKKDLNRRKYKKYHLKRLRYTLRDKFKKG